MKKQSGFTLVELAIIVAIISIMLALAFAGFDQARRNANAASAENTLQRIMMAERLFKAENVRDADQDGIGEFGTLADLLCEIHLNQKPCLDLQFIENTDGSFERTGYYFSVSLPQTVDGCEESWVGRAWPKDKGAPSLTINPSGVVKKDDPSPAPIESPVIEK